MRVSKARDTKKKHHKKIILLVFLGLGVASVLANSNAYLNQSGFFSHRPVAHMQPMTISTKVEAIDAIPMINHHDWHVLPLDRNFDTLGKHDQQTPNPEDLDSKMELALSKDVQQFKPSNVKEMMMASLNGNPPSYIASSGSGSGGGAGNGAGQGSTNEEEKPDGLSPPSSSTVPVPSAIWLLGSALLGFVGCRRNR